MRKIRVLIVPRAREENKSNSNYHHRDLEQKKLGISVTTPLLISCGR